MTLRCWGPIVGLLVLVSSASGQTLEMPSTNIRLEGCTEITLLFRNVSTNAERFMLPAGFIARRNSFGHPIVWLETVFCDSVQINSASSNPGGYTLLLAGIGPPDGSDGDAARQHFYIIDATTDIADLHGVLRSAGIPSQLVSDLNVSHTGADQAEVVVAGELPFTVTFTGAVPTRVHTHNWSFWHSSDRGRAALHFELQADVGSRGTGGFKGTAGSKLDEILRDQPIFGALMEPISARITLSIATSGQ